MAHCKNQHITAVLTQPNRLLSLHSEKIGITESSRIRTHVFSTLSVAPNTAIAPDPFSLRNFWIDEQQPRPALSM